MKTAKLRLGLWSLAGRSKVMVKVFYNCPSSPVIKLVKGFDSFEDAMTWSIAFRASYGFSWYLGIEE